MILGSLSPAAFSSCTDWWVAEELFSTVTLVVFTGIGIQRAVVGLQILSEAAFSSCGVTLRMMDGFSIRSAVAVPL